MFKRSVLFIIFLSVIILQGCSNKSNPEINEYKNDKYGFSLSLSSDRSIEQRDFGVGSRTGLLANYGITKENEIDDSCGINVYSSVSTLMGNNNEFDNSKKIGEYIIEIAGVKEPCKSIFESLK